MNHPAALRGNRRRIIPSNETSLVTASIIRYKCHRRANSHVSRADIGTYVYLYSRRDKMRGTAFSPRVLDGIGAPRAISSLSPVPPRTIQDPRARISRGRNFEAVNKRRKSHTSASSLSANART
ncbi:hypothetical protein PUN28_018105 [Cardiocondyla obscurior]|uniref:Uncharacterized protein n=1 Tax=Cardiocondyla obscurior TaxID=286306 RepID=A0AAW2EL62_9HYME